MRHHPGRFVVCAALVGVTSLAVVLPGGIAAAKKAKPVTGTCSSLSGGAATQTLSGCSDASDPGVGVRAPSPVRRSPGRRRRADTINWTSGLTSIEWSSNTLKSGKADKCHPSGSESNLYEVKEKGHITGSTATDLVGGKTKGMVCVFTAGSGVVTTLFPGSTDTF